MENDTGQEILREIRRLRRSSELASFVAIAALLGLCAFLGWRIYSFPGPTTTRPPVERQRSAERAAAAPSQDDWPVSRQLDDALDRGDLKRALAIAEGMVKRNPNYYYCHFSLGNVHLALGEFPQAQADFEKAYELFPSEENQKALAAVRKRIEMQGTGASPSPSPTPPH